MLESHPPTAIIIDAGFLPHVLELIYDSHEQKHHVVIVVGALDNNTFKKAAQHIKLVRWSDIEAEGASGAKEVSPAPGE